MLGLRLVEVRFLLLFLARIRHHLPAEPSLQEAVLHVLERHPDLPEPYPKILPRRFNESTGPSLLSRSKTNLVSTTLNPDPELLLDHFHRFRYRDWWEDRSSAKKAPRICLQRCPSHNVFELSLEHDF